MDLLAILAKNQAEPEDAASRPFYFQRLRAVENGGTTLCRGNREQISGLLMAEQGRAR